jgi:heptosyltransferase-1/heptosyltransferase-2
VNARGAARVAGILPAFPPQRVLIIKPSSLGDVITALPVLRGLRRTFPSCHIAWLVTPACAAVLDGQGIDEIILFDRQRFGRMLTNSSARAEFARFCRDLRRRQFDWVIDLQGLFRSGFLTGISGAAVKAGFKNAREFAGLFYNRRVATTASHVIDRTVQLGLALGLDVRAEDLELRLTDSGRQFAAEALARHGLTPRGFAILVPGTRGQAKTYPPQHWADLIALLRQHLPVVLVGSPAEKALCEELSVAGVSPAVSDVGRAHPIVNLAGQTDLPQLAAVIAAAGVVVCCDSAASWLAPAVGTPFVTLLGPTRPRRTGPWGGAPTQSTALGTPPLGRAVVADVPCAGCLRRRCRKAECMKSITPDRVLREVLALFETAANRR